MVGAKARDGLPVNFPAIDSVDWRRDCIKADANLVEHSNLPLSKQSTSGQIWSHSGRLWSIPIQDRSTAAHLVDPRRVSATLADFGPHFVEFGPNFS